MGQCLNKDPSAYTFTTPSQTVDSDLDSQLSRLNTKSDQTEKVNNKSTKTSRTFSSSKKNRQSTNAQQSDNSIKAAASASFNYDQQQLQSSSVNPGQMYQTRSELFAMISAPSAIETEALTEIYRVPNSKFANIDQVLQARELELLEQIDEGGFAKVFKARKIYNPDRIIACKRVDIGTDLDDNIKLSDVKNELFVMEKIKHPHVVHLFEHFVINEYLYIFMDYADFGNLYRFMYQKRSPMEEEEAKKPFSQIVSGISYMHGKNIAHRDLKLSNILLKSEPPDSIVILIADFGLSRVVYRRKTGMVSCKSYCGTPNYMAPELKQRKNYNAFEIDMYALGVMLFVLVQVSYPFDSDDDDKALKQALVPDIQWMNPQRLSETCRNLIRSLLEPNSVNRMLMRELIVHKWFFSQMALLMPYLPDLDDLPKKNVASRRISSPGMDIRVSLSKKITRRPKSTDTRSTSNKQHIKSGESAKQRSKSTKSLKMKHSVKSIKRSNIECQQQFNRSTIRQSSPSVNYNSGKRIKIKSSGKLKRATKINNKSSCFSSHVNKTNNEGNV